MKTIETLVDDIYEVLEKGNTNLNETIFENFNKNVDNLIRYRMEEESKGPSLRMSNIGSPCGRKLYFQINRHEDVEPFEPYTLLKFLYGDVIEELLLFLAEAAGHTVEGRQAELEIEGIKGHRDAIIDGELVDVKSVSSFAFYKHLKNGLVDDDPFGYLVQANSYLHASKDDPALKVHDRFHFLVMDKTTGKVHLDTYQPITGWDINESYRNRIEMINGPDVPERDFHPIPEGASGNMKLPMFCTYCNAKKLCHPGLRSFKYSRGVSHLTKVVKEPNVEEIK